MKINLLAAAALFPALVVAAPELPDSNFVYVVGTTTEWMSPDNCVLVATVKSEGADHKLASGALGRISSDVKAAAKASGVAHGDIDGSEQSKNISFGDKSSRKSELKRTFRFSLSDLGVCARLSEKLMATAGVVEFSASFGVSDQANVETKLMQSSVADARSRAKKLAQLLDRKLGRAIAISEEPMDIIGSRFGTGVPHMPPPPFIPPP